MIVGCNLTSRVTSYWSFLQRLISSISSICGNFGVGEGARVQIWFFNKEVKYKWLNSWQWPYQLQCLLSNLKKLRNSTSHITSTFNGRTVATHGWITKKSSNYHTNSRYIHIVQLFHTIFMHKSIHSCHIFHSATNRGSPNDHSIGAVVIDQGRFWVTITCTEWLQ